MSIISFLNRYPDSRVFLNDGNKTYQEMATLIPGRSLPEIFIWNGSWLTENFLNLLAAIEKKTPIICLSGDDKVPSLKLRNGEIAFRSSGTEGSPRWVIHDSSIFTSPDIITFESPAKALLNPAHAAGFDFMFQALRQGTTFSFSLLDNVSKDFLPKTMFGPPQGLASMLFFFQKYGAIFAGLKEYFSSTDSLTPEIVEKCKKLNLRLRLRVFYGSTETMVIKTHSHPDNPTLIKIESQEGFIQDGIFHYTGKTLARRMIQSGESSELSPPYRLGDMMEQNDGWVSLIQNTRNLIKIWGHTVNLKELENSLLSQPGVAYAKVEAHKSNLNIELKITLYGEKISSDQIKTGLPETVQKAKVDIIIEPASDIELKKVKRVNS